MKILLVCALLRFITEHDFGSLLNYKECDNIRFCPEGEFAHLTCILTNNTNFTLFSSGKYSIDTTNSMESTYCHDGYIEISPCEDSDQMPCGNSNCDSDYTLGDCRDWAGNGNGFKRFYPGLVCFIDELHNTFDKCYMYYNNGTSVTIPNKEQTTTPGLTKRDLIITLSSVFLLVLLAGILIVLIVITIIALYKLRNKQTQNKESVNTLLTEGSNTVNLELTHRTDTLHTNQQIDTRNPLYCEIKENRIPDEPNPYNPEYGLVRNELYAGFVEGEVADVRLYEELSQLKNQTNPADIIIENPLYNTRFNLVSQKSICFVEPPASLPELESDLKCCPFEIKREELEIGEQFASGHFGIVYRATYHTERGDIPVAVKTLKESATSDTMVSFMREAATLSQFSHPNVLRLIGVVTLQQPLMIVTELLKTELRELLIKLSGLPQDDVLPHLLFKFSQEIAAGMEYLSGINFIHRDLAARNVLVAKDMTIRVADFGMSREVISESNYYTSSGGTVPLRWTAPEAVLHKKFSEKSDVWSYGMTLYEIWSLGERPWGDSTNEEIVTALTIGHSPLTPSDCPQALSTVMQECWRTDKADRPTFSQLITLLRGISLPMPPHN